MRGRRVAHGLVSVVLAVTAFMTACTTAFLGAATVGAAPPAHAAARAPEELLPATTLDLLSRGAGPRQRLRLASAAGATAVGTVRQDITVVQTVSGQKQPAAPMTVTADLRTTVSSIDDDGRRAVTFAYENASVPELNDVTGSYVVTDRGFTSNGNFEFPPDADAETQDLLQQFESQLAALSTPFPFAAVGKGARWRVTQHPVVNGLSTTQSVVYELVKHDGDRVVLRSTLRQSAAQQPVDTAGLADGTTGTLLFSKGSGAGDLNLDVSQVLPSASTVLARIDQVIQYERGTQQLQIAQSVTTNVSLSSA